MNKIKITGFVFLSSLFISKATMAFDIVQLSSDASENCTDVYYGPGHSVAGGNFELEVSGVNRCDKRVNLYANYAYEGKDVDGNICSGSREDVYIGTIFLHKRDESFKIVIGHCWKIENAWIVDVSTRYSSW